jgi:general secretion pathway protein F
MPAYKFEALDGAGKTTTGLRRSRQRARRRARSCARSRWCRCDVSRWRAPSEPAAACAARARLQLHRPGGVDAPARRPGRLRPAARTRADRPEPMKPKTAPARAGGAPAKRSQRRFARSRARWPARRASSTTSTAPWSPPASRAARWAACSRNWPTTWKSARPCKAKLIGATLYPAIVSLIAVVIVIFLVTYVVPQVASVFTSSKRALPGLTWRCWPSAPSCAATAGCCRWC